MQETRYLRFIIKAGKGVRMDPKKLKAIKDWQAPTIVRGVRAFIRFANFYRRFIRSFTDIVAPLTALTGKGRQFRWTREADAAFHKLKRMFTIALVLAQFDPDRTTRVETDLLG